MALIESGRAAEVVQETRSWDEAKQATASMRSKEGLADYRFFPEPDLSLLTLTEEDIAAAAVRFRACYGFFADTAAVSSCPKH